MRYLGPPAKMAAAKMAAVKMAPAKMACQIDHTVTMACPIDDTCQNGSARSMIRQTDISD